MFHISVASSLERFLVVQIDNMLPDTRGINIPAKPPLDIAARSCMVEAVPMAVGFHGFGIALRKSLDRRYVFELLACQSLWALDMVAPFITKLRLLTFYSFPNDDSPRVIWSSLQTKFFQKKSDILMILDCCSAGSSVSEKGEGMIECLYAAAHGAKTPVSGQYSFTKTPVAQLKSNCTEGITVMKLQHDLTQRLKHAQSTSTVPHYIRAAELPGDFRTITLPPDGN
jgi:hypothetical protein